MTRELTAKAGAVLLRAAFTDKGAALTQTEALDLFAKLKGFEAWSHLQQATSKAKSSEKLKPHSMGEDTVVLPESVFEQYGSAQAYVEHLERKHPALEKASALTLKDVLIQHYGLEGSLPSYPRRFWMESEYWDLVIANIKASELWDGPITFSVSSPVEVTRPDGSPNEWRIEQNLSDRWGELNTYASEYKPGLALIALDAELCERLRSQMWDEITFIVRKDGHFGILFEVEYASIESEQGDDAEAHQRYKPHAEVVASLLEQLRSLTKQYPQVEFCVPDRSQIVNDRPAVWGFCKLDALDKASSEALGRALLSF